MANISQYVFSNLITVQGQNPDIYIDDYGTLYSAFAYQSDDIEYVIHETENNNNRCKEPEFKSFKKMRLKSQLEILIKNYEYQSALNLIEQEKENLFSEEVIDLIKHLAFRSKFDKQSTQYAKQYKLDQGNFEYFYTIKLKQKKGELMDMVLKITPFVNTLLRNQVEDYYYKIYKTEFNELITIEKKNKKRRSYEQRFLFLVN